MRKRTILDLQLKSGMVHFRRDKSGMVPQLLRNRQSALQPLHASARQPRNAVPLSVGRELTGSGADLVEARCGLCPSGTALRGSWTSAIREARRPCSDGGHTCCRNICDALRTTFSRDHLSISIIQPHGFCDSIAAFLWCASISEVRTPNYFACAVSNRYAFISRTSALMRFAPI